MSQSATPFLWKPKPANHHHFKLFPPAEEFSAFCLVCDLGWYTRVKEVYCIAKKHPSHPMCIVTPTRICETCRNNILIATYISGGSSDTLR